MCSLRKVFYILVSALFVLPFVGFAADNVQFQDGAEITANGVTYTVSGSSHDLDTMTVNSGNFTVTLTGNSSLTLQSTNGNEFKVEPSGTYIVKSQTCSGGTSELQLQGTATPGETVTMTITPQTTTCSSGGGGSPSTSSGGGGGGGGGASTVVTPAPTPTTVPSPISAPILGAAVGLSTLQAQSILDLLATFDVDQSIVDAVRSVFTGQSTNGTPAAPAGVSAVFTRGLSVGVRGEDVKRLQQLLNSDPDTQIAASGVGSPSNETDFFGSLTEKAVQAFQVKYGVAGSGDSGFGFVGPKTREKLGMVFGGGVPAPSVANPSPVATNVSPVFTRGLSVGTTGEDVKRLQQLLNSDPDTQIAVSGVGSPSNETDFFGSLTEKAVQAFQVKYGVANSGDPGFGFVGPQTRAKFAEVFGQ